MGTGLREAKKDGHTYLERLGIPVLHFHDGLHGTKIVRELVEFFDPVSKSNRELLYKTDKICVTTTQRFSTSLTGKKLAGPEQSALTRILAKEHHLLERNWVIRMGACKRTRDRMGTYLPSVGTRRSGGSSPRALRLCET
jgi:hypothetical protein